jgi:hypothetical protein
MDPLLEHQLRLTRRQFRVGQRGHRLGGFSNAAERRSARGQLRARCRPTGFADGRRRSILQSGGPSRWTCSTTSRGYDLRDSDRPPRWVDSA